jgi:hypothetical protein
VLPSGDQAGPCSDATEAMSGLAWEPSAFMTQMFQSVEPEPKSMWSNAIFLPSGDQAGYSPYTRLSRLRADPSGRMTQIVAFPARTEAKAILLPSGDQAGE